MPESLPDPNLGPLMADQIYAALHTLHADDAVGDIHILSETPSSNDEATRLARDGCKERTLVFAESQTAGRGRRGNVWNSPPQRDLLCSLVLYPKDPVITERSLRLPHIIAVAICQAIEAVSPNTLCQLKWPNDVYVKGQKIAGILVESASVSGQPFFIAGMGINVNSLSSDRPPELRSNATSLREQANHSIDRHTLAATFLASFDQLYPQSLENFEPISNQLITRSLLLGHEVSASLEGSQVTGKVLGFADNGELIIEKSGPHGKERQTLYSADRVRLA